MVMPVAATVVLQYSQVETSIRLQVNFLSLHTLQDVFLFQTCNDQINSVQTDKENHNICNK